MSVAARWLTNGWSRFKLMMQGRAPVPPEEPTLFGHGGPTLCGQHSRCWTIIQISSWRWTMRLTHGFNKREYIQNNTKEYMRYPTVPSKARDKRTGPRTLYTNWRYPQDTAPDTMDLFKAQLSSSMSCSSPSPGAIEVPMDPTNLSNVSETEPDPSPRLS